METSALGCRGREEEGEAGLGLPLGHLGRAHLVQAQRFLGAPRVSTFGKSQTRHKEDILVLGDERRYWVTRSYKCVRRLFTLLLASQLTSCLRKAQCHLPTWQKQSPVCLLRNTHHPHYALAYTLRYWNGQQKNIHEPGAQQNQNYITVLQKRAGGGNHSCHLRTD